MDERQGHVSALLRLSPSVFYAIGHLRRGGKTGVGQTLTATAPPSSRVSSLPIYRSKVELQHTQRACGLAPASRARHYFFIAHSIAPSRRARSILPCRLTLAVVQPCLQRTPAPSAIASRDETTAAAAPPRLAKASTITFDGRTDVFRHDLCSVPRSTGDRCGRPFARVELGVRLTQIVYHFRSCWMLC